MHEDDFATASIFFRCGLDTGILDEGQVRSWALRIVTALDQPPLEIVEVLASRGLTLLRDALNEVQGKRASRVAGQWLFWMLRGDLTKDPVRAQTIAQQAFRVAQINEMDDEVQFSFNRLDDEIFLADSGIYGNADRCRAELADLLTQLAVIPPAQCFQSS